MKARSVLVSLIVAISVALAFDATADEERGLYAGGSVGSSTRAAGA